MLTRYPRLGAYIISLALLMLGIISVYTYLIGEHIATMMMALGEEFPLAMRVESWTANITSFALPFLGLIFGFGFTLAMIVAARLTRALTILSAGLYPLVHALAGFASVAVILFIFTLWNNINVFPASREWQGFLSLALCGLIAGYVYRALIERNR